MKLLVVLSRFPYPLDKGDKLRAFHFLRLLSEYHEIHLFCLTEQKLNDKLYQAVKLYCKSIRIVKLKKYQIAINLMKAMFSALPFQVAYFYKPSIKKELEDYFKEINPDHVFCQLLRMAEYTFDLKCKKTIDYQDVFSYGVKRRLSVSPFYLKFILQLEYNRLINYEKKVFDLFDNKIIISETDRDLIPHDDNKLIEIISNGVDFDYFQSIDCSKEFDVVFTGNMAYPPNVDAALFLLKEIIPLAEQKCGKLKVVIAGANPHPAIIALKSDYITITGWVEDIRLFYAQSKIFIAPMRIGTGLQNKLLEAMSMQIPCITTSLSNSALNADLNKEILLGNTADELADCVCNLIKNVELRNELSKNALRFIKANYSWKSNIDKLNNLIKK